MKKNKQTNKTNKNLCLLTTQNFQSKVTSFLPQSSGKWLRVLIVVQQQWSSRFLMIIDSRRPIISLTFPHNHAAHTHLCSQAYGPPLANQLAPHPSTQQPPSPLVFMLACSVPLHLEDECGEGGEDNKKETSLCLSSLIGSKLAGPWVKGQSDQSCNGNTSCHWSPTSCLR